MTGNHKHGSGLIMGDLSPHFDSIQKEHIVEETPPAAHPTNIIGTDGGFNEVIQVVHQEDKSRVAPRKIRVLLVITVLGTGGATNVVLDIAGHFNNHSDFDIEVLTGPIPAGRTDLTYLAKERGITTHVIPSLINHINPIVNAKAVREDMHILT